MLFKKTLYAVALTVITLATTVISSPISSVPEKRALFGRYNDLNCKPSSSKPNPVIFLHGLLGISGEFTYMGTRFALEGYCAYSLDYGHIPGIPIFGGLNDLMVSAKELSDFIDKVLAATGASKVDLVGHSEGSVLPRVYLKYFNGITKIDHFTAIGSAQYGTKLVNIVTLLETLGLWGTTKGVFNPVCKACFQLTEGSPFLDQLAEGGDTYPEVKYLMLVSKYDELVTPYTNGFLRTLGPNVHNVVLQDLCAIEVSEHFLQAVSPVVFNAIEYFLRTGSVTEAGCLALLQ
ncbi:hypothetical protein BG015_007318 [Linnemannia schmuckeri]|uniref:Lipase n=1 Tax=Linnemannia schmuckeri TaxID=64567 RepID=A0A9P5VBD2_9FUNG|nr:hypothetical protein BG015_007318 [Linnemannia schmuckeri]